MSTLSRDTKNIPSRQYILFVLNKKKSSIFVSNETQVLVLFSVSLAI